jgi:peptide/nickel transport system substrate-binding protein
MNTDKTDRIATTGVVLGVLATIMVIQLYFVTNSIEVMDEHSGQHARGLQEQLDRQQESLGKLTNEVRRLQDQRRTADELRLALKEGLSGIRQQQPIYVPMPAAGATPTPPAARTQVRTPPAPAPAPAREDTEVATDESTDTAAFEAMGRDSSIPTPDPAAVAGGTLVQTAAEPSTLNYYTTTEGRTRTILKYHILESMFRLSEQDVQKLDKRLATSWSISEDKLAITFNLRRGVQWSDGAPFSADDVIFTFNVLRDPNVEAEGYRGSFVDIKTVEKVDDHTVVVRFKRKYWKGLYSFGVGLNIIPKHWYQRRVAEYARANSVSPFSAEPGEAGFGECFNNIQEPPVGTGPYHMPEGGWDRGKSLTFQRNDNWWRHKLEPGNWNIGTIKWRFIRDHTQQLNQTRQQKIDIIVVKKDEWLDSLSKEKAISNNYVYQNYDHIGLGYNYVVWNCRKFPFNDSRVRRAMTHLVDRKGLLRDLWRDNGVVATCMNKPIYPEYNTDLVPLGFDPEKAAALLAASGFKDLDGDGILDKEVDGEIKAFEFVLKIPSGITEYERVASRMQEAMRKVGVKMNIHPLEWATFIQDLYKQQFDAMSLYNGFSDPWIDNYEDVHSKEDKPRGGNISGLHVPELDELAETARQEFDREKRVPLYHRMYEILHKEQPMTLLVHGRVNVLVHKRFKNITIRHAGMRSTYWWVNPKDRRY